MRAALVPEEPSASVSHLHADLHPRRRRDGSAARVRRDVAGAASAATSEASAAQVRREVPSCSEGARRYSGPGAGGRGGRRRGPGGGRPPSPPAPRPRPSASGVGAARGCRAMRARRARGEARPCAARGGGPSHRCAARGAARVGGGGRGDAPLALPRPSPSPPDGRHPPPCPSCGPPVTPDFPAPATGTSWTPYSYPEPRVVPSSARFPFDRLLPSIPLLLPPFQAPSGLPWMVSGRTS